MLAQMNQSISLALVFFFWSRLANSFFFGAQPQAPPSSRLPVFKPTGKVAAAETFLLNVLQDKDAVGGRGAKTSKETLDAIESAILTLEGAQSVPNPTDSPILDGCWKLLYTSSPGTNSPIQRTFTSFDGVSVYQVINLFDTDGSFLPQKLPDVSNTVCFGDSARLRVTAIASTTANPLVTPREGDGRILGLNIFGISSTKPPRKPEERIDFAFQEARVEIKGSPLIVPYPVPFKLLGDEAKGWLDVTYMSENLRISRGNKGTTFVLKKADVREDPVAAIAASRIDDLQNGKPTLPPPPPAAAEPKKATGTKNANSFFSFSGAGTTGTAGISGKGKKKGSKVGERKRVAIIFPAQLSTDEDYEELSEGLMKKVGIKAYATPLSRLDWPIGLLPSVLTKEYFEGNLNPSKTLAFYLKRVDEAVAKALQENPDAELVLIAHSIGGWVARAWLGEWASDDVRQRVKKLITLGSPHNPPPEDKAVAKIDQTRGLLKYITEKFPGAHEPGVEYVSVIGSGVEGNLSIWESKKVADGLESALAFSSYAVLSGDGAVKGDGIIPVATAELAGAKIIALDDAKHSNFVPTPGKSIKLPSTWYGSEGVIDEWVQYVL